MWHNELKSIQTQLKTISNDRCFDTVTANNNNNNTDKMKIENDVKQLKLKIEQQSYHLTKKKTELINKINQVTFLKNNFNIQLLNLSLYSLLFMVVYLIVQSNINYFF